MAVGECSPSLNPASPYVVEGVIALCCPRPPPPHAESSTTRHPSWLHPLPPSSGKNKRLTKSKKGGKKKAQNPFDKKEWYTIKAPSIFVNKDAGKTLITRTAGTKIASDGLKGRVFEISLADLNKDDDQMFRKVKLCCEDVQGYNVMTNFHGFDLTRDKLCSLIKKWVTLIEANVDVKTSDGESFWLLSYPLFPRSAALSISSRRDNCSHQSPPRSPWEQE